MITAKDIRVALAGPGPAPSSDFDYAPDFQPEKQALRPAAVLIALQETPRGLGVIFTRRAAHLRQHPGQVSFPGGKVEPEDSSLWAAATREASEEIGLADVVPLGALEGHVSATGFEISPQVGLVAAGFVARPDPGEVEEVFSVPLDFLMARRNMVLHSRLWQGRARGYLAIPYGPHYIWGASARMIRNLADRLETT
ncbi:MAG: CoA pyrophosphatase [Rhodobacteraceae bacterium]|nr:CoA pyrophosphatase [Paracoccaceae bacterium]